MSTYKCRFCGISFTRPARTGRKPLYCSRRCSQAYRRGDAKPLQPVAQRPPTVLERLRHQRGLDPDYDGGDYPCDDECKAAHKTVSR